MRLCVSKEIRRSAATMPLEPKCDQKSLSLLSSTRVVYFPSEAASTFVCLQPTKKVFTLESFPSLSTNMHYAITANLAETSTGHSAAEGEG